MRRASLLTAEGGKGNVFGTRIERYNIALEFQTRFLGRGKKEKFLKK